MLQLNATVKSTHTASMDASRTGSSFSGGADVSITDASEPSSDA